MAFCIKFQTDYLQTELLVRHGHMHDFGYDSKYTYRICSRPEVATEVKSSMAVIDQVSTDVRVKVGDSRSTALEL